MNPIGSTVFTFIKNNQTDKRAKYTDETVKIIFFLILDNFIIYDCFLDDL